MAVARTDISQIRLERFDDITNIYKLIRLYRANECLWNTKSAGYHNIALKENAWQRIVKLLHGQFSIAQVKLQVDSLRNYYEIERAAIEKCDYYGEIYVPRHAYYYELGFLKSDKPKEKVAKAKKKQTTKRSKKGKINCFITGLSLGQLRAKRLLSGTQTNKYGAPDSPVNEMNEHNSTEIAEYTEYGDDLQESVRKSRNPDFSSKIVRSNKRNSSCSSKPLRDRYGNCKAITYCLSIEQPSHPNFVSYNNNNDEEAHAIDNKIMQPGSRRQSYQQDYYENKLAAPDNENETGETPIRNRLCSRCQAMVQSNKNEVYVNRGRHIDNEQKPLNTDDTTRDLYSRPQQQRSQRKSEQRQRSDDINDEEEAVDEQYENYQKRTVYKQKVDQKLLNAHDTASDLYSRPQQRRSERKTEQRQKSDYINDEEETADEQYENYQKRTLYKQQVEQKSLNTKEPVRDLYFRPQQQRTQRKSEQRHKSDDINDEEERADEQYEDDQKRTVYKQQVEQKPLNTNEPVRDLYSRPQQQRTQRKSEQRHKSDDINDEEERADEQYEDDQKRTAYKQQVQTPETDDEGLCECTTTETLKPNTQSKPEVDMNTDYYDDEVTEQSPEQSPYTRRSYGKQAPIRNTPRPVADQGRRKLSLRELSSNYLQKQFIQRQQTPAKNRKCAWMNPKHNVFQPPSKAKPELNVTCVCTSEDSVKILCLEQKKPREQANVKYEEMKYEDCECEEDEPVENFINTQNKRQSDSAQQQIENRNGNKNGQRPSSQYSDNALSRNPKYCRECEYYDNEKYRQQMPESNQNTNNVNRMQICENCFQVQPAYVEYDNPYESEMPQSAYAKGRPSAKLGNQQLPEPPRSLNNQRRSAAPEWQELSETRFSVNDERRLSLREEQQFTEPRRSLNGRKQSSAPEEQQLPKSRRSVNDERRLTLTEEQQFTEPRRSLNGRRRSCPPEEQQNDERRLSQPQRQQLTEPSHSLNDQRRAPQTEKRPSPVTGRFLNNESCPYSEECDRSRSFRRDRVSQNCQAQQPFCNKQEINEDVPQYPGYHEEMRSRHNQVIEYADEISIYCECDCSEVNQNIRQPGKKFVSATNTTDDYCASDEVMSKVTESFFEEVIQCPKYKNDNQKEINNSVYFPNSFEDPRLPKKSTDNEQCICAANQYDNNMEEIQANNRKIICAAPIQTEEYKPAKPVEPIEPEPNPEIPAASCIVFKFGRNRHAAFKHGRTLSGHSKLVQPVDSAFISTNRRKSKKEEVTAIEVEEVSTTKVEEVSATKVEEESAPKFVEVSATEVEEIPLDHTRSLQYENIQQTEPILNNCISDSATSPEHLNNSRIPNDQYGEPFLNDENIKECGCCDSIKTTPYLEKGAEYSKYDRSLSNSQHFPDKMYSKCVCNFIEERTTPNRIFEKHTYCWTSTRNENQISEPIVENRAMEAPECRNYYSSQNPSPSKDMNMYAPASVPNSQRPSARKDIVDQHGRPSKLKPCVCFSDVEPLQQNRRPSLEQEENQFTNSPTYLVNKQYRLPGSDQQSLSSAPKFSWASDRGQSRREEAKEETVITSETDVSIYEEKPISIDRSENEKSITTQESYDCYCDDDLDQEGTEVGVDDLTDCACSDEASQSLNDATEIISTTPKVECQHQCAKEQPPTHQYSRCIVMNDDENHVSIDNEQNEKRNSTTIYNNGNSVLLVSETNNQKYQDTKSSKSVAGQENSKSPIRDETPDLTAGETNEVKSEPNEEQTLSVEAKQESAYKRHHSGADVSHSRDSPSCKCMEKLRERLANKPPTKEVDPLMKFAYELYPTEYNMPEESNSEFGADEELKVLKKLSKYAKGTNVNKRQLIDAIKYLQSHPSKPANQACGCHNEGACTVEPEECGCDFEHVFQTAKEMQFRQVEAETKMRLKELDNANRGKPQLNAIDNYEGCRAANSKSVKYTSDEPQHNSDNPMANKGKRKRDETLVIVIQKNVKVSKPERDTCGYCFKPETATGNIHNYDGPYYLPTCEPKCENNTNRQQSGSEVKAACRVIPKRRPNLKPSSKNPTINANHTPIANVKPNMKKTGESAIAPNSTEYDERSKLSSLKRPLKRCHPMSEKQTIYSAKEIDLTNNKARKSKEISTNSAIKKGVLARVKRSTYSVRSVFERRSTRKPLPDAVNYIQIPFSISSYQQRRQATKQKMKAQQFKVNEIQAKQIQTNIQATPLRTKPIQAIPTRTKPIQAIPIRTKPIQAIPFRTKPIEGKQIQTKQIQTKQIEGKQIQNDSMQTRKIQSKQFQTKQIQTNPISNKKFAANREQQLILNKNYDYSNEVHILYPPKTGWRASVNSVPISQISFKERTITPTVKEPQKIDYPKKT